MESSSTKGGTTTPQPFVSRILQNTDTFVVFLWNPKTKTFLGRTATSWAKILVFYVVFYSFLAAIFSIAMATFYSTLSYQKPTYTDILTNPGLGFRPRLPLREKTRRHLLSYDVSKPASYLKFIEEIDTLLEPYTNLSEEVEYRNCTSGESEVGKEPCVFEVPSLNTTCTSEDDWGYPTASPCIFLKLNKIIDFMPKPITTALPLGLQKYINDTGKAEDQHVWVWCEGEGEGVVLEQSSPGLPLHYYPYTNQPGYLQPLAVLRVNATVGESVKMTCKVWAENVQERETQSSVGRLTGRVDFEVHVTNSNKDEL